MLVFLSGIIVGIIFFQTSIVAPSIFRTMEPLDAQKFIRELVPKLFAIIAFLSISFVVISVLQHSRWFVKGAGGLGFLLCLMCYAIVPATNRAKDEDRKKAFSLYHSISLMSTMLVMLMNVALFLYFILS